MASQVLNTLTPQQGDSIQTLLARIVGTADRGTMLASAARTASVNATIPGPTSRRRGVVLFWDCTVASGTGGLTMAFQVLDPVSLKWMEWAFSSIFSATGSRIIVIAPGYAAAGSTLNGGVNQSIVTSLPMTESMRIRISHSDASSYTYSLGYELL